MPYSREAIKEIKERRRQLILDQSLYLFALKGYDMTTIDDIAKASSMTHSLFYHYFRSKEEIFFTLLSEAEKTKPNLNIDVNLSAKMQIKELINFIREIIIKKDKNAFYLYLFLNLHFQKTLDFKKIKNRKNIFGLLYDLILEGQKEGTIIDCDPKELIVCFGSMLGGITYSSITSSHNKCIVPSTNVLVNLFLKKEENR